MDLQPKPKQKGNMARSQAYLQNFPAPGKGPKCGQPVWPYNR